MTTKLSSIKLAIDALNRRVDVLDELIGTTPVTEKNDKKVLHRLLCHNEKQCERIEQLQKQVEKYEKALEDIAMHANPDMDNHVEYYNIAHRALTGE